MAGAARSALPDSLPSLPVLLQALPSHEARAVTQACLLGDIPCARIPLQALTIHGEALRNGLALPVGSVEFLRAAMALAHVQEPDNLSYPPSVATPSMLRRHLHTATLAEALSSPRPVFVKPVVTKAFTGQMAGRGVPEPNDAGARANRQEMLRLDGSTAVWMSEPLTLSAEWRLYLEWADDEGRYVERGRARYDEDGLENAPALDEPTVEGAIAALSHDWRAHPDRSDPAATAPAALALDLGVTNDAHTVLIEANDFWAIGLYGRALDAKVYLRMLNARWRQLHRERIQGPRAGDGGPAS